MTKVLCDAEKCIHNVDWVCILETVKMKSVYYEPSRTYGYYAIECREYKEEEKKQ